MLHQYNLFSIIIGHKKKLLNIESTLLVEFECIIITDSKFPKNHAIIDTNPFKTYTH
jgi:hypothetical protein